MILSHGLVAVLVRDPLYLPYSALIDLSNTTKGLDVKRDLREDGTEGWANSRMRSIRRELPSRFWVERSKLWYLFQSKRVFWKYFLFIYRVGAAYPRTRLVVLRGDEECQLLLVISFRL